MGRTRGAQSLSEFGDYHRHLGEEYILILDGELILHTEAYAPAHLKTGDSVYFDSGIGHAYVCGSKEPCRALIMSIPSNEGLGRILDSSKLTSTRAGVPPPNPL